MYSLEITQASNFVKGVDTAFFVILGISFLFLIFLTVVMLMFIYRYNRKRHPKAVQTEGSAKLEVIWIVIPVILFMLMFYFGWTGYKPMVKAPDDAMEVNVYGQMWDFKFEYDNGKVTDTLYLPKGKPVKLNLNAMDMVYSLYIPAFRVKQDMVPGKKKNFTWFEPQEEGVYELYSAEYSGLEHSNMYAYVKVVEDSAFYNWVADTTFVASADVISATATGRKIMQDIGCFACHTIDGGRLVGPTFKGIWGTMQTVRTGKEKREVLVDEEYMIKSIYEPDADLVDGFAPGLMLSYEGQLTLEDIDHIIEYIKTLE